MKTLFCTTITPNALRLIRRYEGDVVETEAIVCHYMTEEPSRDRAGNIVDGAYIMTFPNKEAICYSISGEIAHLPAAILE
ncbi:hypothetical protein [Tengunoibacter tsumagoiensis]|uniref:Uncharacterized protein n=1 Tax=Tengunoibacter tsumagoiensis TaxID=2014871 RepID=A0A401ZTV3_9CHLR|nr:hypothetical protein [Tengunoibacter tsumagoiensis]GCE10226.1 hypothetical protein KTT_00850 [Tengunoibacter tsumagoiensis]